MGRSLNRFITTTKHVDNPSTEFGVIVMSGQWNYRMKSYGPKALIPVNDRPAVLQQIDVIRSVYPRAEIYITVGYEADKVIRIIPPFVRIVENQKDEANEVEELRLALNCCTANRILIINGDIIFNSSTIQDINQDNSLIVVDTRSQMPKSQIGVTIADGKATILNHTIKNNKWCEAIYLTGTDLSHFRKICSDRMIGGYFFYEAVNMLLNKVGGINIFEPERMRIVRMISNKEVDELDEDFDNG